MNKRDVKNILISMRTHQNETAVNNLLGKIDLMEESRIQEILNQLEDSEEAVREELSKRIVALLRSDEKYPINSLFTYGISGNSVHLHLPGIMQIKGGMTKKFNTVNLYLLDAIEKVARLKGRIPEIEKIYMISPILTFKVKDKATGELKFDELGFLGGLGFDTEQFTAEQLGNQDFLDENPEAVLAKTIFGSDKNVGRASIDISRISTPEWQAKKQEIIELLRKIGISLEENSTPTKKQEGEEQEQ